MTRSVYADPASGVQHSIETLYQPCSKDRKEVFLTKDGPLFKLKDGVTSYPDNPLVLVATASAGALASGAPLSNCSVFFEKLSA